MKTIIVGATVLLATMSGRPLAQQTIPPYQNQNLPFEVRARDLVSRMTLEEKVSQMNDVAVAIPRLGVPEYNWWNEALHGVARSGLATVFPQAIGMAATWDAPLMLRTATVISDEARAKHEEYLRHDSHQRYQGLTIWSPNINIFRDPRWGRGQETYGEDPFLTGTLAVQFIHGLQGDDPKYLKTVATVKHFAVHSGPEPERHTFDAVVSDRDLRETYLPHFEMGIQEGGAYSLMCAYNRIDGKPACGSDLLLKDILRGEWRFSGYVVSDCGAIDDIHRRHKSVGTPAEAAALGVKTGTDLECSIVSPNSSRTYTPSLPEAVKQGLIAEAEIDTSVTRLMLARMKLGMFDSVSRVKWAQIPFSVLDQPAHRDLALTSARESMVLLKNAGGLLPLSKSLKTIAVIGPNANQWQMLLGNYNGLPKDPITPLRGIREAMPNARVIYAQGSPLAENFPVLDVIPARVLRSRDGTPGWSAEYFHTHDIAGTPLFTRVDPVVDMNWFDGAPRSDMNVDDFAVRWTATLTPPATGTYRIGVEGTVKFQVYLNGSLLTQSVYPSHDGEFPDPRMAQSQPLTLEQGHTYVLRVEAEETYGDAQIRVVWGAPHETLLGEAIDAAKQADAVVMFLGLTSRLEGEEMSVQVPGFRGGDRTSIDLPAPQEQLLERVMVVGKPTALVLMSGSALATTWAQDHVPAIVEAWYPGQAAGTAIADVLFGDYNPAGRLPVTFYRSVTDLPAFDDYAMKGRTYRFFSGTPLYPFGFGLSYTTFAYKNLRINSASARNGDTISVTADVTNTGARAGDEVAQLYVRHLSSKVERPLSDLRGYARVSLQPGETKAVSFRVPVSSLAYWDAPTHSWIVEAERLELGVGASSRDIRLKGSVNLLGK